MKPLNNKTYHICSCFDACGDHTLDYELDKEGEWLKVEDVKEAVLKLLEKIKLSSNRDEKVKAQILLLDCGGIGKQELRDIIKEIFGDLQK
jgi:hypothetical protein